jgi:glutamine amidotransferase
MCRHVGYWGPEAPLADTALDATHPLLSQCTDAHEMLHGCENLDGWGYAWFDREGVAHRYRTARAMTEDEHGLAQLRATTSRLYLVHARQKSPGSATDASGSAPFWDGGTRLFAHNGVVTDFRNGVRDELLARLSPRRAAAIVGDADSEVLFGLVLDRIDAGKPAEEALSVLAEIHDEFGGRYNVLFTDGERLIATRRGNSLYLREADGVTVASEPLEPEGFTPVPDAHMVINGPAGTRKERW